MVIGTPLQNELDELWTLFDIVKPGLLGTYAMFEKQFERVIKQGGTKAATNSMIYMAYRCAMILKRTIEPYMLRRTKKELLAVEDTTGKGLKLPKKSEQVLFCKLSSYQVKLYKEFLANPELENFLKKSLYAGSGLKTSTRKPIAFRFIRPFQHICNHPQLFYKFQESKESIAGESANKTLSTCTAEDLINQSGKMKVLAQLLATWSASKTNNKVLLFSQSRGMLDIFENIANYRQYSYLRMDGSTSITSRQTMIDEFNNDPSIFLFLLTTKVGGVGINLTGANKVIIYDPDWNPTTDSQARERAYRLGQQRDVKVMRFITAGTIEEKVYERQIFKQYLTNKVLEDPRQKGMSKLVSGKGMRDLFVLSGYDAFQDKEANIEVEEVAPLETSEENRVDGVTEAFRTLVNYEKVQTIDFKEPENQILKQNVDKAAKRAFERIQQSSKADLQGTSSSKLLAGFAF